jgi:hypothetical protein
MSPELFNQILEGVTDFLMKFLGISLGDVIAQMQPVFETIIALFTN